MAFKVTAEQIAEIYQTLDKIGCLGRDRSAGYLRAAYSNQETEAMKFIEALAIECGARSRWDKVGCLALEWAGSESRFVETASHLDTVPCGGNFDGAAGVVAGLAAIREIVRSGAKLKCGFRLRVWRSEEFGCFGVLYAGSKSAFGQLDPACLTRKFQNLTLEEAMRSQGADPEMIKNKIRSISQEEVDLIKAHVELHIEQANLLENKKLDVGIVTSIRASKRYRIVLTGEFDHSGATPMGPEFRKDVNLAIAYTSVQLDKLYQSFHARGFDLVQTICVINSNKDFNQQNPAIYSNATSVISGFGYFELEFRSNKLDTLNTYTAEIERLIPKVAAEFNVKTEIHLNGSGIPLENMDLEIQDAMEKSAKLIGASSIRMPSGAGHDAAIVGAQKKTNGENIPVGMLFIPCLLGKSHNPAEYASNEAIAIGASVLANGLFEFSQS